MASEVAPKMQPRSMSWRRRNYSPEAPGGPETLLHPLDPAIVALVKALLTAAREFAICKKPKVCQRKNAIAICRRISAMEPLFEEVRDSGVWVAPSALAAFRQLRSLFQSVRALLHNCRHSSNLLLLMEQNTVSAQYDKLSMSIAEAISSLPFELLEVSSDSKDLAALLQRQFRRQHIDAEEQRLRQQVVSVMDQLELGVIPDSETLKHIFDTLHLNDAIDCERELSFLEEHKQRLKADQMLQDIPNTNSLISFVRYARCVLYGLAPEQQVGAAACRKYDLACPSMKKVLLGGSGISIPDDFKCPISLEMMVDPVVVATGHSYERTAITRWIEAGHTNCPKTGVKLANTNLIPNSSLRRLIVQWCAENDYVLEAGVAAGGDGDLQGRQMTVDQLPSTKAAMEATRLTAQFLVDKLKKNKDDPDVQRQAAYELRLMAKEGMDNRACVAAAGAVPELVRLLKSTDAATQEHAVTALLNVSLKDENKELIIDEDGAMDDIVGILCAGGIAGENAAAALFSLTVGKAGSKGAMEVGNRGAAVDALLKLMKEGSRRGRRDATHALLNVALRAEQGVTMLLMKGTVSTVLELLAREDVEEDDDGDNIKMSSELVALLSVMAKRPDGMEAVAAGVTRVVPRLIQMLGSEKISAHSKEHSVALLLAVAGLSEQAGTSHALRTQLRRDPALLPALHRIAVGGTPRGQRKATSLLKLLQRTAHGGPRYVVTSAA